MVSKIVLGKLWDGILYLVRCITLYDCLRYPMLGTWSWSWLVFLGWYSHLECHSSSFFTFLLKQKKRGGKEKKGGVMCGGLSSRECDIFATFLTRKWAFWEGWDSCISSVIFIWLASSRLKTNAWFYLPLKQCRIFLSFIRPLEGL